MNWAFYILRLLQRGIGDPSLEFINGGGFIGWPHFPLLVGLFQDFYRPGVGGMGDRGVGWGYLVDLLNFFENAYSIVSSACLCGFCLLLGRRFGWPSGFSNRYDLFFLLSHDVVS